MSGSRCRTPTTAAADTAPTRIIPGGRCASGNFPANSNPCRRSRQAFLAHAARPGSPRWPRSERHHRPPRRLRDHGARHASEPSPASRSPGARAAPNPPYGPIHHPDRPAGLRSRRIPGSTQAGSCWRTSRSTNSCINPIRACGAAPCADAASRRPHKSGECAHPASRPAASAPRSAPPPWPASKPRRERSFPASDYRVVPHPHVCRWYAAACPD